MEKLIDLLDQTMESTLDLAREVGKKVVNWDRVTELETRLKALKRQFGDERERLVSALEQSEMNGENQRGSAVHCEKRVASGADLPDSEATREGADLPGGNAPLGLAVL